MKDRIFFPNILSFGFFPLVLYLSACLCGCASTSEPIQETGFYFDTVVSVTVYDQKDVGVLEECMDLCARYEQFFSPTLEGSDVYRINHSGGKATEVSEETVTLLKEAISYAESTDGLVDPTIAPLTRLWNFSSSSLTQEDADAQNRVPEASDILDALSHIDYKMVQIDGNTVTLLDPQGQIDLGFIAKGYIADRLKELLLSRDVTSALINLGGNVLAVGARPDGTPFQIGLQEPFSEHGTSAAVLPVTDWSVVSSGIYERCFEQDGQLYHHLLDSKTGYPIHNGLASVTILSSSSTQADALSTICFCLGLEEGKQLAESLPEVEAVFLTQDGQLITTSGVQLADD